MIEKLTAGDIFNGWAQGDAHDRQCLYAENAIKAMKEYAAQQVQQIMTERDFAIDLLKQANSILNVSSYSIEPGSLFAEWVQHFLNSINKING